MHSDQPYGSVSAPDASLAEFDLATELRTYGVTRVLIVRTFDETNALVRLQSGPVLSHASRVSTLPTLLAVPGETSAHPGVSLAVFHYNDLEAVAEVRRLSQITDILPVCLGSDLYSFDHYLHVHDLAEIFVMPTELHRRVLAAQVARPVFHVDEALDVIGLRPASEARQNEADAMPSRRILWFGYAESFGKSMATLVPAVHSAARERLIDDFVIMVDQHRFANRYNVRTIDFDPDTFWKAVQKFDYCLLSHMPLDLKLNSFLKSPNKAITALTAGLIPLASRTPAYESLLTHYGLDRFLFSSAAELMHILQRLDPVADRERVRQSGIVEALLQTRSNEAVARRFLACCTDYLRAGRCANPVAAPTSFKRIQPELGFVDHLRGLAPSLARAAKMRFGSQP